MCANQKVYQKSPKNISLKSSSSIAASRAMPAQTHIMSETLKPKTPFTPASASASTTIRSRLSVSGRTQIIPIPSATAVVLPDWWLVHDEGKGLAVAGLAYKANGPRLFCSSTIVKRHDSTTVESVDGIVITIIGPINNSRTLQNGVALEICNRFLLGFPYFWEEYAAKVSSKQSTQKDEFIKRSIAGGSTAKRIFSDDLNNLSATEICDFLMSPLRDSTGFTLDDILGEKCINDQKHTPRSKSSKRENQTSVTATKHSQYETRRDRKDMPEQNNRDAEGNSRAEESITPIPKDMIDQKHQDVERNFNADEESIPPRIGVVTRSMSRSRNFYATTKKNLSGKARKVRCVKSGETTY